MISNQEINRRFADIMNIQTPSVSNPYFLKQIFAMGYREEFMDFYKHIENRYENIDEFVKHQAVIREQIFNEIKEHKSYKSFNEMDMNHFKIDQDLKGLHQSIYHERCEDCYYLSLDLKKANFQVLKYLDPSIVKNADSYEAFISHYTDDEWIIASRAFRQVGFGQLNGKRISTVSKWLIGQYIKPVLNILGCGLDHLEVFQKDEVIFKLPKMDNYKDIISKINSIELEHPVEVHIELFKIEPWALKDGERKIETFYVKTLYDLETLLLKEYVFKGVPSKYKLIANALFFNRAMEEFFLIFDIDGIPSKMLRTLQLEKIRKED